MSSLEEILPAAVPAAAPVTAAAAADGLVRRLSDPAGHATALSAPLTFADATARARRFAALCGCRLIGDLTAAEAADTPSSPESPAPDLGELAERANLAALVLADRDPSDDQIAAALDRLPPGVAQVVLLLDSESTGDSLRVRVDRLALASGFRRHPRLFDCAGYAEIEQESGWRLLPYERIPAAVLAQYPLSRLMAERYLHMDMSRAEGRRSEAHLARYRFASEMLGPDARILDAASGLGYGSYLMWREAPRREITGLDLSSWVVDYANASFGAAAGAPRFIAGDANDLSHLPADSLDAVVSFETLEHLLDPTPFLTHVHRLLAARGLLIASVPYRWVTRGDTGPHHHDWYDAPKLIELIGRYLSVESLWIEVAGGGRPPLTEAHRAWRRAPVLGDVPDDPVEWLVIVARKRPPISRSTKSWLAIAPGLPQLSTMVAAMKEWEIAPEAVHVHGFSFQWDDDYERAMQEGCDAFGLEYGGNLMIPASVARTAGDPLDYAPDDPAGRDACSERVRTRHPILTGLEDFDLLLSTRPHPMDHAILAGLQARRVRLVADGIQNDLSAYDLSGARGFAGNALAQFPTDHEVACPPWLAAETAALAPARVVDGAAALDRLAAIPTAQRLVTDIATRRVPITAIVISQNFSRSGLTSTEASWVFSLHQIRALLAQTPGAVLFKAHPRDCRHKMAALTEALRGDADRVAIAMGAEAYVPLEAFRIALSRVDTLDVWGTSSSSLLALQHWPGARVRCIDADYLEPEIRRQALQTARRHGLAQITLAFADPLLTENERRHLRRRFVPPPSERTAVVLGARLQEAEEMRVAARARMEQAETRLREVEQHAQDALLLEALVTHRSAPIWIWGCGAAGRSLLARLRRLGLEPAGFIDGTATGPARVLEGLAVIPAIDAHAARGAGTLVIVASIHAAAIVTQIQQMGDWQATVHVWSPP